MTPNTDPPERTAKWQALLANNLEMSAHATPVRLSGRLTRATGMIMHASGLKLPVGSICEISGGPGRPAVEAEVVGFVGDQLQLMASNPVDGLAPGAQVRAIEPAVRRPRLNALAHGWRRTNDLARHLPVGAGLLGRVIDARGNPLDGMGELGFHETGPIRARPVNAMLRQPIDTPLDTGVRAINAMLTVGRGQRLGLFAPAGVGKSVLLGMMASHTRADVIVVGLIGERSREVREFIDKTLGPSARQRATVVAAPADEPPLIKIQAAVYATAIADYYRRQGLHVLLLMDSLTRYAMAMREVALATGEPPATRGYPPSVFARLPELIERAGNGAAGEGSVTAFYTVLVDPEDTGDPVGEAARSFLDGHVALSAELAESGHYPAIDIERSISRVMNALVPDKQLQAARTVRAAWAHLRRNRDLVSVGAYQPGSDPALDNALQHETRMKRLLQQDANIAVNMSQAVFDLQEVANALNGITAQPADTPAAGGDAAQ